MVLSAGRKKGASDLNRCMFAYNTVETAPAPASLRPGPSTTAAVLVGRREEDPLRPLPLRSTTVRRKQAWRLSKLCQDFCFQIFRLFLIDCLPLTASVLQYFAFHNEARCHCRLRRSRPRPRTWGFR